jgi:Fe2+ transport system protein FeoA
LRNAPVPLTELASSDEGLIVDIDGREAARLSGYGLYPGITIRVHQTFPSFVVKADETEVAIESRVARMIRVIPTDSSRKPIPGSKSHGES